MTTSLATIKIAVVDDFEVVRSGIIKEIGNTDNMSVILEASNGQDLINQIEKANTLPDVCLLDVYMPVMDGFKTLDIMRKRWPGIKNIIYSMYKHNHMVQQFIVSGAHGYISKGSPMQEVYQAINDVIAGKKYYPGWSEDGIYRKDAGSAQKIRPLMAKEIQLLTYIGTSLTYTKIGEAMRINKRSVETLRDSLFEKLRVHSRQELTKIAEQMGITTIAMPQD